MKKFFSKALLLILVIIDKDFIVDKIISQKNKKEILDR